jgi:hypothetical protein
MVIGETCVSPPSDVPVAEGERPAALDPPTEDAIARTVKVVTPVETETEAKGEQ